MSNTNPSKSSKEHRLHGYNPPNMTGKGVLPRALFHEEAGKQFDKIHAQKNPRQDTRTGSIESTSSKGKPEDPLSFG